MGHVDISGVDYRLPDGRALLHDVGFRVGDGSKVALVGTNGCGKTTLLRIVAGDLQPHGGAVTRSGGLGVMRQFVGTGRGVETVRELLVSISPPRIQSAAAELVAAERELTGDDRTQLRFAQALADWTDAAGYDAEVLWDICCTSALGIPYEQVRDRDIATLSGGEQKRLALEALLRGRDSVLVLDEPDNYLDVPSKRWLEQQLQETPKTVLFVSHDRELLANTAERIVTLEGRGEGNTAWVHGGGFASYHEARLDRHDRFDELRRRWDEERAKLAALVEALRLAKSSKTQAAVTRLRRHEASPPPEPPRRQHITMRLGGGRTGVRALECRELALRGLTDPFDLDLFYGERLAVLGANGTGKSHFLRLLAGWPDLDAVAHDGNWKLGARVVPGHFSQTHERPDLAGRSLLKILWEDCSVPLERAAGVLHRYELTAARDQLFQTLSGGQQARFQILLLELSGATMLVLDEPTDNLDVDSAEALEAALAEFDGTVVAVTHDRWFARSFERFVVFGSNGRVVESPEPVWGE
ncbi:MAG TPA: ATP-binding cassette domain-containing protein [Mycobacteriales bacterium]|nr:ATP-binding cassette domain-containing protein [Mycobacteriales bacterium]